MNIADKCTTIFRTSSMFPLSGTGEVRSQEIYDWRMNGWFTLLVGTGSTSTMGAKLVTVLPKAASYEEEEKMPVLGWWYMSSISEDEDMEFARSKGEGNLVECLLSP
ncbi:hypothetical protein Tco_1122610 [Tanacetum coccineum]|uniref:Uncharacterized protein n=1 Tax=Tanacetum coccineum TaxID=301880 RepID=A0ABQ5J132_9ASTR